MCSSLRVWCSVRTADNGLYCLLACPQRRCRCPLNTNAYTQLPGVVVRKEDRAAHLADGEPFCRYSPTAAVVSIVQSLCYVVVLYLRLLLCRYPFLK